VKNSVAATVLLALAAGASGEVSIGEVKGRRELHKADGDRVEVFYRFADDGEKVTSLAHVKTRAAEAAEAWKAFDKDADTLVVLARSPFGGGESAGSYWPAGVKPELLRQVVPALRKAGFENVVLPDLPPEEAEGEGDEDEDEDEAEIKPYPKQGFSTDDDQAFVLVVGLHHEKIPYRGASRRVAGEVIRAYSSRTTGWAILFHGPTGCAIWATTSLARVGKQAVSDTLNSASEAALVRLSFAGIDEPNIEDHIRNLQARSELPQVDIAAVLVQTQRVDAVWAVMKAAMGRQAFRNKAWVVRFFNSKSVIQDYRLDEAKARSDGCVMVNQRVPMRYLLMEQLRGVRTIQPLMLAAMMPLKDDVQIVELAQELMTRQGPATPDDEIVLITELAHQPPDARQGPWKKGPTRAVRNLGACRHHIDEAMAVARVYASRRVAPPRRGRRPRRDPLREAGQQAMRDLSKARAERSRKAAADLKRMKDRLERD